MHITCLIEDMKKLLSILIMTLMAPFGMWAQSYDALWKQVDEASRKDLPKTQIDVLKKIVNKAQKKSRMAICWRRN